MFYNKFIFGHAVYKTLIHDVLYFVGISLLLLIPHFSFLINKVLNKCKYFGNYFGIQSFRFIFAKDF
jgi:hypothetical protein